MDRTTLQSDTDFDVDKPLTDRFWEMRHGLQRSYYYYESRRCFWMLFLITTKALEFWIGYSPIADLINGESGVWLWIRSSVAVLSFILTSCNATQRITTLGDQMREMHECLGMMPYREKDETEKRYKAIKEKREKAEQKDDVIFEVLDAMCYNKACKTLGATERWKLTIIQKFFGWWLPLPFTTNAQLRNLQAPNPL